MRAVSALRLTSMVAVAAPATGCGLIVGDYQAAGDTRPGGSGGTVNVSDGPPILPAIPDPERETSCEQCAVANCDEPYQACLDEPSCEQMLRCKGICDDPDCLLACDDRYPESWQFEHYWTCVFDVASECVRDCGSGRNFGCSSEYRWEGELDREVRLDLRARRFGASEDYLAGNDALAGALVRLCTGLPCELGDRRHPGATTDAGGWVSLEYLSGNGVFAEIAEGTLGDRVLYYDAPVLRDTRREVGFFGREWRQYLTQTGDSDVQESPIVWTQVRDCLGVPAIGVDVVLNGGGEYRRAMGVDDFAGDLTSGDGRATFYDLTVTQSQKVTVEVFSSPTETRSLARRTVVVRDGWWSEVKLYPHVQGDSQTVR